MPRDNQFGRAKARGNSFLSLSFFIFLFGGTCISPGLHTYTYLPACHTLPPSPPSFGTRNCQRHSASHPTPPVHPAGDRCGVGACQKKKNSSWLIDDVIVACCQNGMCDISTYHAILCRPSSPAQPPRDHLSHSIWPVQLMQVSKAIHCLLACSLWSTYLSVLYLSAVGWAIWIGSSPRPVTVPLHLHEIQHL